MTQDERRLLRLFRSLPADRKAGLLDYAAYLAERAPALQEGPAVPVDIPRPAEETVIMAIRRLKQTYPMLDANKLLHATSGLMAQHVVHKRPAAEVIDELEALFRRLYDEHAKS